MVEEDWVDRGDGRSAGSDLLWPPFVSGYEEACGTRKEVVGCWGGADRSMWCSDGGGRRKGRGIDRIVDGHIECMWWEIQGELGDWVVWG